MEESTKIETLSTESSEKQSDNIVQKEKGRNSRNIPTVVFIVSFLYEGKS